VTFVEPPSERNGDAGFVAPARGRPTGSADEDQVDPLDPDRPRTASTRLAAFRLYDNVFVLADREEARQSNAHRGEIGGHEPSIDPLDEFDIPERDRMYKIATEFVARHVRILRSGASVRAAGRTFRDGSLVISERPIPRLPFRVARLNWIIEDGAIVDISGHHVTTAHLRPVPVPAREVLWAPGHGDRYDVAYLIANVCAVLGLTLPESIAAFGDVLLNTNAVLGTGRMDDARTAAEQEGIRHLILPFDTHLMSGELQNVRYWVVRDALDAVYAMFSAAASDVVVPDLKRRWLVKMACSWTSMLSVLGAGAAYQFAAYGTLEGSPGFGKTVLAATLGVVGVLFALSCYATHRYFDVDR
jgi:hypothetical protein